jgi:hypothetical protein
MLGVERPFLHYVLFSWHGIPTKTWTLSSPYRTKFKIPCTCCLYEVTHAFHCLSMYLYFYWFFVRFTRLNVTVIVLEVLGFYHGFLLRRLFISLALQSSVGYGLLVPQGFVITHNDAPQSVRLLWTSDQLVTETSIWQHTQHKTSMPPVGFQRTI